MTLDDVVNHIKADTKFNQARKVFYCYSGMIGQQVSQGLGPVEVRKLEFEAIEKILSLYGIDPNSERLPQTESLPPPQMRRNDEGTI